MHFIYELFLYITHEANFVVILPYLSRKPEVFKGGGGCFPLIKCLVAKKKKTSVGAVNPIVNIAATGNCINGPYQYTFM